MIKDTVTSLVGSLSRALGNDLVSYEEDTENTYVLKLWPPISQHNKRLLKEFISEYIPRARVSINTKRGLVKITLRPR